MDYRKTITELKYYASDLNKYIANECTRKMSVINIDLCMYKEKQNGNNILRIIESKHSNEDIPKQQLKILMILAELFKWVNKWIIKNTEFELFVITADPPYDYASIWNLINDEEFDLKSIDFKRFLEFKNFDHIPKENNESNMSEMRIDT
tara:strand:- start:913 stop:1362 length:450 start_codon:yes stop_codon:yes gene_type:complete